MDIEKDRGIMNMHSGLFVFVSEYVTFWLLLQYPCMPNELEVHLASFVHLRRLIVYRSPSD